MSKTQKIALAAVVALGLAGAAAVPLVGHAQGWGGHGGFMRGGAEHVEGRIAFLKTELKITDAQAQDWNKVADVMRDNAKALTQLRDEARANGDKPQTAVERLGTFERFAQARAKAITAFADAFKPLYDRMSDDQRKSADALLAPQHHRG